MHSHCTVATWNMDHWKRTLAARRRAWSLLEELGVSAALLQETVPPADLDRTRVLYRPICGTRPWGNAIATFGAAGEVHEIQSVRTRYSSHMFPTLGTIPGTVVVAKAELPELGPITLVSVYGLIDVYAQTTMLRVVADLIPLFDSADGEHLLLGGDFNVSTSCSRSAPERPRYAAILKAIESLGLKNLADVVEDRPDPPPGCPCGYSECKHLATFRGRSDLLVGGQLDYLYATPSLAQCCQRIWVADEETRGLSDHAPILAEFSSPQPLARREWDPATFARELAARHGERAGAVAREIYGWAENKQAELLTSGVSGFALDRFPSSSGSDPELWVQLDLNDIQGFQYTVSLRAKGTVVVQFQYMHAPFDTVEARSRLLEMLNSIPGVSVPGRLNGRPSFPISALFDSHSLERFISVLDEIIDTTIRWQTTKSKPSEAHRQDARP